MRWVYNIILSENYYPLFFLQNYFYAKFIFYNDNFETAALEKAEAQK